MCIKLIQGTRFEVLLIMAKKLFVFLKSATLFLVVFAVTASSFASPRGKRLRQTRSGVIVNTLSKRDIKLNSEMQSALLWAEHIDRLVMPLMEVTSMGRIERWLKKRDLDAMKMEYSKSMIFHLKAVTVVFKSRRQSQGFLKLREFDFQNMIRKSDYLLSLYLTKESFNLATENGLGEEIEKVLKFYNQERVQYDQKMITIALD